MPYLSASCIPLLFAGLSQKPLCTTCTWGPVWCGRSGLTAFMFRGLFLPLRTAFSSPWWVFSISATFSICWYILTSDDAWLSLCRLHSADSLGPASFFVGAWSWLTSVESQGWTSAMVASVQPLQSWSPCLSLILFGRIYLVSMSLRTAWCRLCRGGARWSRLFGTSIHSHSLWWCGWSAMPIPGQSISLVDAALQFYLCSWLGIGLQGCLPQSHWVLGESS